MYSEKVNLKLLLLKVSIEHALQIRHVERVDFFGHNLVSFNYQNINIFLLFSLEFNENMPSRKDVPLYLWYVCRIEKCFMENS